MTELDKSVYRIADILGKRNDVPFIKSTRDVFLNIRATFLRRDFDKNLKYREEAIQSLGKLELVKVEGETQFGVLSMLPNMKRTKDKIPLPIETKHPVHFKFVGNGDGYPELMPTSEFEIEHMAFLMMPTLYGGYIYKDEYIFVHDFLGDSISIKTMFKDPRDCDKFSENIGANCSTEESIYTPDEMIHDIENFILDKYRSERPEEEKSNKDQIEL